MPKQRADQMRRLHPKLRMIKNGKTEVNVLRAEHSSSVAATSRDVVDDIPLRRGADAVAVAPRQLPREARPTRLRFETNDIKVSVFVDANDPAVLDQAAAGPHRLVEGSEEITIRGRCGNLAVAEMTVGALTELAGDGRVASVSPGESLEVPEPVVTAADARPPRVSDRKVSAERLHHDGRDVFVGIIDVQGFDFSHPDFLDGSGRARFHCIWDQGGEARPEPGGRFAYGAEFTRDHLNAALRASRSLGLPPWEIERQSQVTPGSHGTHVASIAAGNRGICRKAKIGGVLVALDQSDYDRRLSFYDSTRVVDAIDYLVMRADAFGCKAVSINVSLGTNGHAHDASSPMSRWLDSVLATPGRAVSVAAGNAGQEAPTRPDDLGYIMGRIHTAGRIPATGLDADIEWVVGGNGIEDISENELEIWYSAADRFAVSVRPPGTERWLAPVEPGYFLENHRLASGAFVSVYNELYHEANGANHVSLYLSPWLSRHGIAGVPAGTWTVRLHGREVRDGRYDGWVERDDPRGVGRVGDRRLWRFPSFFTPASNVDRSSVSSLACGQRVISVANLDAHLEKINKTSSQGPTRDGRPKPDVSAPGTEIVAANGFDPEHLWVSMTGTSMASPYVAGVVGLMLAANPRLTAAQLGGIIKRTAVPLPGDDFEWSDDAGYGVIDEVKCVREAAMASENTEIDA